MVSWTHSEHQGFTVKSKNAEQAHPLHVCCVLDISGSMSSSADIAGGESTGLSVLDVVKHATLTILESLKDTDKFSLVSFSDEARIEV